VVVRLVALLAAARVDQLVALLVVQLAVIQMTTTAQLLVMLMTATAQLVQHLAITTVASVVITTN
jgi:hypothetical protein